MTYRTTLPPPPPPTPPHHQIGFVLGLSRFTHVMIRFDSIQLGHDPIDSIRFTIHSFRPIRLKFSNSECHLIDLLNEITMNKMTINKITMNKEHKIHHNTSASNCNNIILFVMLDKNQFVGIFWQQCR